MVVVCLCSVYSSVCDMKMREEVACVLGTDACGAVVSELGVMWVFGNSVGGRFGKGWRVVDGVRERGRREGRRGWGWGSGSEWELRKRKRKENNREREKA